MPILFLESPRGSFRLDDGGGKRGLGAVFSRATPVVLVHGAAGRLEHWAAQLEALRERRRAVALDLPGMGLSEPPRDNDWTPEAMADALDEVVEARQLERFVLAGHSMGGNVAAAYARAHPDRVAALVLVDAGPWSPSAAEWEELRQGFRPAVYERFVKETWYGSLLALARPGTRATVLRDLDAFGRDRLMAVVYGGAGFDLAAAALAYPGPRLAVCAEATGVARRWAEAGVEAQVVSGVSHWLQMDDPGAVTAALEAAASGAR